MSDERTPPRIVRDDDKRFIPYRIHLKKVVEGKVLAFRQMATMLRDEGYTQAADWLTEVMEKEMEERGIVDPPAEK